MADKGILGLFGAVGTIITILSLMFLYVKTLIGSMSVANFTSEAAQLVVPSPTEIIITVVIAFVVVIISVILAIIAILKR